jgi:hypothetical protein
LIYVKVIPAHVAIRARLRESVDHALSLNTRLEGLIAIKPRQPSGVFHGKVDFSQPPWHSPVATVFFDMHALSRKIERDLRYELGLPSRYRGCSDANTKVALEAAINLCERADDFAVRVNTKEIEKWSRRASIALGQTEVPKRLPRSPGHPEPKCPFCKLRTLRSKFALGEVYCINPACKDDDGNKPRAHMEYSKHVGDWVMVWQDNVVGLPV